MPRRSGASEAAPAASAGDRARELMPLVYDELRAAAGRLFRTERRNHTLQPTALVHEVYLKLATQAGLKDQTHFKALAGRAMRQILVDHARRRRSTKHGGQLDRIELDKAILSVNNRAVELLDLEAALQRLEALDQAVARLIELRFFAGLTVEETAHELGESLDPVKKRWRFAKAWLHRELSGSAA